MASQCLLDLKPGLNYLGLALGKAILSESDNDYSCDAHLDDVQMGDDSEPMELSEVVKDQDDASKEHECTPASTQCPPSVTKTLTLTSDDQAQKLQTNSELTQQMMDDALKRLPLNRKSEKPTKRRYGKVALKIDIYIERCKQRMEQMQVKINSLKDKD